MSSAKTKLAALALKGDLQKLKDSIDPDTYGGAPLLGVEWRLLDRTWFIKRACNQKWHCDHRQDRSFGCFGNNRANREKR